MNFVTDEDIANISKYFQMPEFVKPIADIFYSDDEDDVDDDGQEDFNGFETFEVECSARKLSSNRLDFELQCLPPTEPIEIPLHPIESLPNVPIVERLLRAFNEQTHQSCVSAAQVNVKQIDSKRFAVVRELIENYIVGDTTVQLCIEDLLKLTKRPRVLCACLLEIVEDTNIDDDDEELQCHQRATTPAATLSRSHQRIIGLIKQLSIALSGGSQFDRFCMSQTERTLFKLSVDEQRSLSQTINLVRLYIGLSDCTDSSRMRLFVYKCFYYYNHTATPMVFVSLMAHPKCLPILPAADDEFAVKFADFDPLVQTIHVLLMNFHQRNLSDGVFESNSSRTLLENAYKKEELQYLMWRYYQQQSNGSTRVTNDQLIENLCKRLTENRLRNVANAFILLAKRMGYAWAKVHIVDEGGCLRHFLNNLSSMNDEQIVMILHTIGSIVKTYPLTQNVNGVQQMFVAVLESTSDRQCVQEAAISALLQTARFGLANVYDYVRRWQPAQPVNRTLWLQLQTFVHRKPRTFWK